MNFKTRLWVTFITIIALPVILTTITFLILTYQLIQEEGMNYGIKVKNFTMWSDSIDSFEELTDQMYARLQMQVRIDPSRFLDKNYLEQLNQQILDTASYIIVRKNDAIYYTGNDVAARQIVDRLPDHTAVKQREDPVHYYIYEENAGYYYSDMEKLVRQIDFMFKDGDMGSIFIVTKINSVISKPLVRYMLTFIVLILVITGILLTQWIRRCIFLPLHEMNIAMHHIAKGNFDYVLESSSSSGDEMTQLFRRYEDMRLKLKESTEEMMEKEKQNKELVSNISHDLKTPITSIKGYIEGIVDGVADTPEKKERYLKTIYTKACDVDRLISELSYYTGIGSNRIPYHFHRLNVTDYFNDCVEDVGLELEAENIQLNYTNLVNPDTNVIADPEQMKKVINNIIGNSIKYMEKDKKVIDIRLLEDSDSIRIEIEDNGKGIASKDLGNIFERFYRTDESRNSSQGGSGIGLSIVKKIIEDHGGYIWATSKENVGTCMHFVLRKHHDTKECDSE